MSLVDCADGRAVKAFDSKFFIEKLQVIEFRKERRFKSYSARFFFLLWRWPFSFGERNGRNGRRGTPGGRREGKKRGRRRSSFLEPPRSKVGFAEGVSGRDQTQFFF